MKATANMAAADHRVAAAVIKQEEHESPRLAGTEAEIAQAVKNIDFQADPTPPTVPKGFAMKAVNPDTSELAECTGNSSMQHRRTMGNRFLQRNRSIIPRMQSSERHRHLPLYPPQRRPPRTHSHAHPSRRGRSPPQNREMQSPSHRRRRQSRLPRSCVNQNIGPHHSQDPLEQRHLHRERTIHESRHQGFLPQQRPTPERTVRTITLVAHPSSHHRAM